MKPLPEKFLDSLRGRLGAGFPAFLGSLQEAPPVSVRLHPRKKNDRLAATSRVPWSEWGRYLPDRPVFTLDPLFHAGSYYVQEASSMFLEQAIAQSVDLKKALNVLDLCAAPGGKSTHLLSLLNRESFLVSNEAIRSRASILSENIQKWGYPNAIVTNNDPADFQALRGFFDVMVVDAPCSGEGLFRKDPGAAEEWSPESVQLCCARQKRIVSSAWDALREEGVLIYCTCTYNESENEENLAWLKQHHDVAFVKLSVDRSWGIDEVDRDGIIAYRFFPHQTKGEGFFISVMRKKESTRPALLKSKAPFVTPSSTVRDRLREWIHPEGPVSFFQFQDLVFFAPAFRAKEIELAMQRLRIVYAGTNLARVKHDKLIPEHALALSVDIDRDRFPLREVAEADALRYLRKETITLEGAAAGFTLLTFQGLPIGWANVLSNRVNNLYPPDWRIRMAGAPSGADRP